MIRVRTFVATCAISMFLLSSAGVSAAEPSATDTETARNVPEPEPAKSGGSVPVWAWVSLGVGGASLISAAILTVVASGQQEKLSAECPSGGAFPAGHYCLSNDFKVKVSEFETTRTASYALWAVGAVGVSAGIIGMIVGKRSASKPANALVVPWVSPSNAGLSLMGRF